MAEQILTFADALAAVLREARTVKPGASESVAISAARGRILAAVVTADRDQPAFDRATRDGFAIRNVDATSPLKIVGQVRAGERWHGDDIREGEAVEVMTGAPMPAGTNAVVMVEHAAVDADVLHVETGRTLRAGENVVPRGAEAHKGEVLLPIGRRLEAAEIAVAASCGCATLEVFAKPKIAIIATGDELVEVSEGRQPGEAEIYNSNSYALRALVEAEGGFAGSLAIARDTRNDLIERITEGATWDLLLLSGGVSMGKYDLVEEVLRELGAEFFFTGALIQPGKPIVFGRMPKHGACQTNDDGTMVPLRAEQKANVDWTYFFGLPGNPVSAQLCFQLFVAPLVRALTGRKEIEPTFVEARLAADVEGGAKVTRFLPAELTGRWDGATVQIVAWQGSGDVAANARGNCYCVLPSGVDTFSKGETVRVLLR